MLNKNKTDGGDTVISDFVQEGFNLIKKSIFYKKSFE